MFLSVDRTSTVCTYIWAIQVYLLAEIFSFCCNVYQYNALREVFKGGITNFTAVVFKGYTVSEYDEAAYK